MQRRLQLWQHASASLDVLLTWQCAVLSCRVVDVMTATPITVHPETDLDEAAT